MEPLTILTVFAPLLMDGAKALIGKFTGNQPAVLTANDYVKLLDADIRKLQALADLDKPAGETYPWVNTIRSLQRPVVVVVVLIAWSYAMGTDSAQADNVSNLASAVFFYLFGERGLGYIKRKP